MFVWNFKTSRPFTFMTKDKRHKLISLRTKQITSLSLDHDPSLADTINNDGIYHILAGENIIYNGVKITNFNFEPVDVIINKLNR
jgi:hypothetical protein